MIVAIAGLSGAGKNTVGGEVARLLGIREVQISFKNEAQKLGIPLMEMQNRAGKDRRSTKRSTPRFLLKSARETAS